MARPLWCDDVFKAYIFIAVNMVNESSTHMSCVTGKHALKSLSLSYQKKDWRGPAGQTFFWHDTDVTFK